MKIAGQISRKGRRILLRRGLDRRVIRAGQIRIMRLIGPADGKERLVRLLSNPLQKAIDGAAIFASPRTEERTTQIRRALQKIEGMMSLQEPALIPPVEIAARDVSRASPTFPQHGGQRFRQGPCVFQERVMPW